jgi:hypothetical protein
VSARRLQPHWMGIGTTERADMRGMGSPSEPLVARALAARQHENETDSDAADLAAAAALVIRTSRAAVSRLRGACRRLCPSRTPTNRRMELQIPVRTGYLVGSAAQAHQEAALSLWYSSSIVKHASAKKGACVCVRA